MRTAFGLLLIVLQTGKLHKKTVDPISSFCPYFSIVLHCNAFRNGQSKPEASGTASRFIGTIKSLENIPCFLRRKRLAFVFYGQKTSLFPILLKAHPRFPAFSGILLGIVQQDIHDLSELFRAALYMNILNDPLLQHTSALKEYRLKGQQSI